MLNTLTTVKCPCGFHTFACSLVKLSASRLQSRNHGNRRNINSRCHLTSTSISICRLRELPLHNFLMHEVRNLLSLRIQHQFLKRLYCCFLNQQAKTNSRLRYSTCVFFSVRGSSTLPLSTTKLYHRPTGVAQQNGAFYLKTLDTEQKKRSLTFLTHSGLKVPLNIPYRQVVYLLQIQ